MSLKSFFDSSTITNLITMPLKGGVWKNISVKELSATDQEQKDALEKLRASEERYRAIITVSNTGAWEYDLDTDVVWYSAQYFAMLGFDRPDGTWDNSIANAWVDMLHPDDRERAVEVFDEFLKGGSKGVYEQVFRMQHSNGDWVWISSRAKRLRDSNGNLTNITLGTHSDISDQVRAEEKIKGNEQLLKKITSQVPGNTYMFEIEETGNTIIHFSNRGTDMFNHSYDLEDLLEHPNKVREAVHDDDKEKFNNAMKEAYQTNSIISIQYRMVAEDGHIRWRWMQAIPEKNADEIVLWYGATSDITPLVDYIASIEQVIFDIGHVIRRPISSMMGMTSLINGNDLSPDEIKDYSQKLYEISDEMDKFIRELNDLYHQKRLSNKLNINVSSVIDQRDALFS